MREPAQLLPPVPLAPGVRTAPAARRVETNEARLAAIVASSDDAIIALCLEGHVTDWNRGAEVIFGYGAQEMIGHSITRLAAPGEPDDSLGILERIRRGEHVDHYVTRRRRKDGQILDVSLTVSPLKDRDGRLLGVSKVARDITERQQTQQRLQNLQAELAHVSRLNALGEMASALSHELNQPLTAVANYLSGSRRLLDSGRGKDIPLARDAIERAAEQALRAGEIIRRLREFVTRSEDRRRPESVFSLVEEASAMALLGAKQARVRVSFAFDPSAPRVFVDRIQIQQVLLNLMRNAMEAMEETERRELTVSSHRTSPDTVRIDVADTGPGIAPEVATQLFRAFLTTKRDGMGVGLSISRTIIEAHGGRIWAAPREGGGTVFYVTLKAAQNGETDHD